MLTYIHMLLGLHKVQDLVDTRYNIWEVHMDHIAHSCCLLNSDSMHYVARSNKEPSTKMGLSMVDIGVQQLVSLATLHCLFGTIIPAHQMPPRRHLSPYHVHTHHLLPGGVRYLTC